MKRTHASSLANPDRTDQVNWVFGKHGALVSAAAAGNLDLVRELVAEGADVNEPSPMGVVPLHRAAQNGHSAVVEFLLQSGALPGIRTAASQTPADLAAAAGHEAIATLLRTAEREPASAKNRSST